MQAVMTCSKKRFVIEKQSDPIEFFSWLLNALHHDLTGGKVKKQSVLTRCFQASVGGVGAKGERVRWVWLRKRSAAIEFAVAAHR